MRARKSNETTGIPESVEMEAFDIVSQRVLLASVNMLNGVYGRGKRPFEGYV